MKKNLKNIIWLSVPLLFAVGCSENGRDRSISYSPAITEISPTSDRLESRAYPDTSGNFNVAVPPGAAPQDWQVAQEIGSLLLADKKLGTTPMGAVVNNGVVTLRGCVRSRHEREQLVQAISQVPGVQRVDDQLNMKNPLGNTMGESKSY